MKKTVCFIVTCLMCCVSQAYAVYTIDGKILDWGVDLSLAGSTVKGFLDTNVPTGSNVDYVTEDNTDKDGVGYVEVGPGFSTKNTYDAEAMYFDNDGTYAYLAIVSGLPKTETAYPSGDIFISTVADPFTTLNYGFAIDVFTGNLYTVGAVENVKYSQHSDANPWRVTRSNGSVADGNDFVGTVPLVYSSLYNTHSVIEAQIPLSWINADEDVWLHWTMWCGNDVLNLHGTVDSVVPEPATGALFLSGLLGWAGLRRRKKQA